jgi:hypothetical protein
MSLNMMNLRSRAAFLRKTLGVRAAAGYLRNRGVSCEVARVILFAPQR